MESCNVRELGGEIWAELTYEKRSRKLQEDTTFDGLDVEMETALLDLIMEVLARHEGQVIVNHEGFPVKPRPFIY